MPTTNGPAAEGILTSQEINDIEADLEEKR